MAQADGSDRKEEKRAPKWKMVIRSWLGTRQTGEWVRESIATNVKRTFKRHTHGAESTKKEPVIVEQEVEELVYQHDVYRPNLQGEKNTRKATFWRGARIWRD
jgi:hypothetical protein